MITLFRAIRLWQLRTKYRLALWQFIDQQAKELLKNPEEIEKKFVSALADLGRAAGGDRLCGESGEVSERGRDRFQRLLLCV